MARPRYGIVLIVLFTLASALAPLRLVRAEAAGDPDAYRALIDAALREYQASHFEEARALFQRAHQLTPNARTHRGIGMTEFELRNYRASILELRAALASDVRPLEARLREDTEALLQRAQRFVTEVHLSVRPGASLVMVDGLPVALRADAPLLLQVGDHLLELHAKGFLPERRQLVARGGDIQTIDITFARPLLATPRPEEKRWYKSAWLWSSVGVLAAGAAAGGVYIGTREPGTGRVDGGTSGSSARAP